MITSNLSHPNNNTVASKGATVSRQTVKQLKRDMFLDFMIAIEEKRKQNRNKRKFIFF